MHALKAMKDHKWQLACGPKSKQRGREDGAGEQERTTAERAEGALQAETVHETRIRLNASLAITSAIIMCVTRQQNGTLKGHDGIQSQSQSQSPVRSHMANVLASFLCPRKKHIAFSCGQRQRDWETEGLRDWGTGSVPGSSLRAP